MAQINWTNRIAQALAEINSTPAQHTGPVIWGGDWCSQDNLCLIISYSIAKSLNLKSDI